MKIMFSDGDIQHYESKHIKGGKREKTIWIDNRTRYKPHPIILPFALSNTQVYIMCPYCGRFHVHGNSKGDYEGFRVPHCDYHNGNADYYIAAIKQKAAPK